MKLGLPADIFSSKNMCYKNTSYTSISIFKLNIIILYTFGEEPSFNSRPSETLYLMTAHVYMLIMILKSFILCFYMPMTYMYCYNDTVSRLQNQLNTLEYFCIENGFSVNIAKTKVVVFRNGGQIKRNECFYF